jgi:DNA-binding HxlR family transcriptional regulator
VTHILYIVKYVQYAILENMKEVEHTTCPITKVAILLSDTWTMLIMHALTEGPKRFCELETALTGISTRTLTLKLQKLTMEGLVEKNATGGYQATKKGAGLKIIETAMKKYSAQYLEQD